MFLVQEGLVTLCSRQSFPIIFFHLPFLALGGIDFQSENYIKLQHVYAAPMPKMRFTVSVRKIFFKLKWTKLDLLSMHVNRIESRTGTAKEFGIPLTTLIRRLQNPFPSPVGNPIAFTQDEEALLWNRDHGRRFPLYSCSSSFLCLVEPI